MSGTERKGIHSVRVPVLDLALFDLLGTWIAAYLLAKYVLHMDTLPVFFGVWLIGVLVHCTMRIKTPVTGFFCGDPKT